MLVQIKKMVDTVVRIIKLRKDFKMTKEQKKLALKIAVDVVALIEISSKGDSALKKIVFELIIDALKSTQLEEDK